MTRTRYRFLGRRNGWYYWEALLPLPDGDSRHERVRCPVEWFWRKPS